LANAVDNNKLSSRRETARRAISVEYMIILVNYSPVASKKILFKMFAISESRALKVITSRGKKRPKNRRVNVLHLRNLKFSTIK